MQLLENLGRAFRQQGVVLVDALGVLLQGVWDGRRPLQRAVGRTAGMLAGALICLTITFLGIPLNINLAGEWGLKPASPILWVLCTPLEMHVLTTKKS